MATRRLLFTALAGFLGIALTASLGAWQLRRAAAKEVLQHRIDDAAAAPAAAPDASFASDPAAWAYRRLGLRGRWVPEQVVYLDNRPNEGRAGFYVLMPLRVDGIGASEVIVNRGWLPRAANDRTHIAPYRTPEGTVTITGVALPEEPRLLDLGADPGRRLNAIWQNFDVDDFTRAGGGPAIRAVVRQDRGDAGEDDGLDRRWPDRGGALQGQIDRHHGYAFQWFALAATLAALLLFQVFRSVRHARSTPV